VKQLLENWRKFMSEDVGGFTAEYQLFIPKTCTDEKCEPAKLNSTPPVENRQHINKPYGGFWTSTAIKEWDRDDGTTVWTSEWNEWMKTDMPQWMHPQGILLKPKTNNVFHIENHEDVKLLHEEFPLETEYQDPAYSFFRGGTSDYNIDYEAALQKYDAIHWGMKGGGWSGAGDFGRSGMWDVESTVWRDASVLEVVGVIDSSQKEKEDGEDDWEDDEDMVAEKKTEDSDEVVKIILHKDGSFLGLENGFDTLDLPGGHVQEGEKKLEALEREVKEETGLTIDVSKVKKVGMLDATTFYVLELPQQEIKISDEHSGHKRVKFSEPKSYNLSDKYKKAVEKAKELINDK